MPNFGLISTARLNTCDHRLQHVLREVVIHRDCIILCGNRGEEEQNRAFREGNSTKQWPDSKHNKLPSEAVDVAPYWPLSPHVHWNDVEHFYWFAGYVVRVADEMGIRLRWGGDWDSDGDFHDQRFMDLVHFEVL